MVFKKLFVNVCLLISSRIGCYLGCGLCYMTAWVGSKFAAVSGTPEVVGKAGGSESGDDSMEWEWGWEVATWWGTGTKTSRNYMPICKVSALCALYSWQAAWWELRGHECAERALPAIGIHLLKGQSAKSSAVYGTQVRKFGYKYTKVPTLNPIAFHCIGA